MALENNRLLAAVCRPLLRRHYRAQDLADDQALLNDLAAKRFTPQAVLIQIARVCNLRCLMCGWTVWKRNKGFMPMDLYRRILAEMSVNGIRHVNLTNPQGEPLLSPHAMECIRLALDEGFEVCLNTNCTPLSEKKIADMVGFAASGRFTVQASFSGYDKQSHEEIYVGSRFEQTVEKLRALNAALAEKNLQHCLTVNGIILDRAVLPRHLAFLRGARYRPRACDNQPAGQFRRHRQGGQETQGNVHL